MNSLESIPQTGVDALPVRITLATPARRVTPAVVTSSGPPESPMQMFGLVDPAQITPSCWHMSVARTGSAAVWSFAG